MRGTFSAWGESLNDTVVPLAHHPRNSPFPVPPTAPCVYLSRIRVHYDVDILGVRGDVSRRVTKGELFPSVNPPNVQSFIRTPSTASTPTLVHLSPPCDDSHYSTSPSEVLLTAHSKSRPSREHPRHSQTRHCACGVEGRDAKVVFIRRNSRTSRGHLSICGFMTSECDGTVYPI